MKNVILSLFLSVVVKSEPVKVLIIDTGVDTSHKSIRSHIVDPIENNENYVDTHGHGTHIAGLVTKNLCNNVEVHSCKFFSKQYDPVKGMVKCLKYAKEAKFQYINISAGGLVPIKEEYELLKEITESGTKVIAAAGNGSSKISTIHESDLNRYFEYEKKYENASQLEIKYFKPKLNLGYYPASYPLKNLIVVGSAHINPKTSKIERDDISNYGIKNMVWERGANVTSTLPNNTYGSLSGTSQATAIVTNKILQRYCE